MQECPLFFYISSQYKLLQSLQWHASVDVMTLKEWRAERKVKRRGKNAFHLYCSEQTLLLCVHKQVLKLWSEQMFTSRLPSQTYIHQVNPPVALWVAKIWIVPTTKQPLLTTSTNSEAKAHTPDVLMQVKEVSASVGSANAGVVRKVSKVSMQQRLADGG